MKLKETSGTTILIDIDGVLSPLGSTTKDAFKIQTEWCTWSINGYIAGWLYFLSKLPVNLISISAHEDNIKDLTDYFELPELDYLIFEDNNSVWAKKDSIEAAIKSIRDIKGNSHKIVLIDDEIPVSFQIELQSLGVTTLVPDSRYGLLEKDIKTINSLLID